MAVGTALRRGIATVSLSGRLEDKLPAIAAAGFDGIELFENDLVRCPLAPSQVRARLDELGLELMLYQPFRDLEAVPTATFERNLERARRKFALLNELGATKILVCSNVSEEAVDDDELAISQLRELAELAAGYGVTVAYEALAWGRWVNTTEHAWQLVEAVDHPNLGLCVDSFHFLARGEAPETLRAIPGDKIEFVQLADAPLLKLDVLQWSRHHRCMPWQGDLDVQTFVEHVLEAGYQGPLSLELFSDVLRQTPPLPAAIDAMRSLVALEDSVTSDVAETTGSPIAPPARADGYAFAELEIDWLSQNETRRLLSALGFSRVGPHRSKPVELWENGGARIVLNRNGDSLAAQKSVRAKVSAIALNSAAPEIWEQRADRLLAPRLRRRFRPDEADLISVRAPDGTAVFFCNDRPASSQELWLNDFLAVGAGAESGSQELTGIDHIALSQPLEIFGESLLFYRAVLGLDACAGEQIQGPDGLLNSRALTSRDGRVRIVLNSPTLGSHPAPELEHVAFGCKNVFAVAERLSAAGLAALPIPENYYDDLDARFSLPRDLLESMRALDILYDRHGDGEFFHLYTPLAGGRVFFEVVQRQGGYDGFGAANSAIRLAALHA